MSLPTMDAEKKLTKTERESMKPQKGSPNYTSICLTVIGLYVCYITSTVMQEAMYEYRNHGTDSIGGDRFESASLLVFIKSLVNFIFSSTMSRISKIERVQMGGRVANSCAVMRFIGTILSIYSLNFISYPYAVLGKSIKIIPVLISEFIVKGTPPSPRRCISVMVTTMGMVLFSSDKILGGGDEEHQTISGFILLGLSLCMDGALASAQSMLLGKTVAKHCSISTMIFMSKWQTILSFFTMILSLNAKGGIVFCLHNVTVIKLIIASSLIESIGQAFLYSMIVKHGAFKTAVITTLRKFFTILISIGVFGHELTNVQWFSIVFVFIGVSIDFIKR